ncbi:DUF2059 domain-containing protein [Sphingomonas sp. TDK1]|uniref:DUF2059 domain-containing protein n=1 Tax=Sphingomonas sp. TDK1 TaxID=453247 RepID=UPI0007D9C6E5|nr:DUF2059 domain-containing protein [Sphingomonas sp. TDK1]OAN65841.1 hypothetical protein A7X12_13895 [Sphingomonas sp. TDK1]
MRALAAALLIAVTAPGAAMAQTAPAVQAPEPARLAAATALIAKIMPPQRIDTLIDQMMRPMMDNLRNAMAQSPQMQAAFAKDPKAKAMLDGFVSDELQHSMALTKASMPTMLDAMARAYARRFTVAQMRDVSAFFDTPSGKIYAEQAPTVMADPDVLAAQRAVMEKSIRGTMERAQAMVAKFAAEQDKK